jgi:uncharacterized membrane protein YgaE (UPF0421/DUF939 family)
MEYKKTPETNKSLAERIAARGAKSFMEINKELIALQTKHDELVELVAWYFEVKELCGWLSFHWGYFQTRKVSVESRQCWGKMFVKTEDALRKAVEEK